MLKRLQISLAYVALLGVVSGPVPLLAQPAPDSQTPTGQPPAPPALSPDQLDTLLAPIALYPDPLLAQILPAATQPAEIVMADRYVKAQKDPNQIDSQPWDESVKALARYPDVLSMMDKQLDWTTQLGEAFINQPSDVYASVQRLRAKAEAVGNLKTTPQQVVSTDQNIIQIMPADPQIIYVPQYQPDVVYVQQPSVVAPLITFGAGLALGIWIHNQVNWHGNNIYYHNNGWNGGYYGGGYHGGGNNININNNTNININNGNGNVWKPQNKPRPPNNNGGWNGNKPGNGGNNGWNGGNGNKPGNGGNNGWNGGNGNKPGNGGNNGWTGNKPGTGNGDGSKPGAGNGWTGNKPGNGSGTNRPGGNNPQKPSTLPGQTQKPTTKPAQPTTRPAQPTQRPMPSPNAGKQQFNRDASKPAQSRPAQQSRPAPQQRQAPAANRGGGGGNPGGGGGGRRDR